MAADTVRKIKRSPMTQDERLRISSGLQIDMLDLIRAEQTDKRDIIFHGGTSISYVLGSPRSSEDLDFMATPAAVTRLFSKAEKMAALLQMKASMRYPEAAVDLNIKKGGEGAVGEVAKINLRWEHPDLIGAVKVKVEFYACPQDRIDAYQANLQPYGARGAVKQHSLYAATPETVWADKILALALRPMLKHRDIHDLGLIAPMLSEDFDRFSCLSASMGIYGQSFEAVRAGLERDVVADHAHNHEAFVADMQRWFQADEFSSMVESGHFRRLHDGFLSQYDAAKGLLLSLTSEGPEP